MERTVKLKVYEVVVKGTVDAENYHQALSLLDNGEWTVTDSFVNPNPVGDYEVTVSPPEEPHTEVHFDLWAQGNDEMLHGIGDFDGGDDSSPSA